MNVKKSIFVFIGALFILGSCIKVARASVTDTSETTTGADRGLTSTPVDVLSVTNSTSVSWTDWIAAAKAEVISKQDSIHDVLSHAHAGRFGFSAEDAEIRRAKLIYPYFEPFGTSSPGENEFMLRALNVPPSAKLESGEVI